MAKRWKVDRWDEHGDLLTKPSLASSGNWRRSGRLLGAHRQIIDHQFRGRVVQFGDDLFASRILSPMEGKVRSGFRSRM